MYRDIYLDIYNISSLIVAIILTDSVYCRQINSAQWPQPSSIYNYISTSRITDTRYLQFYTQVVAAASTSAAIRPCSASAWTGAGRWPSSPGRRTMRWETHYLVPIFTSAWNEGYPNVPEEFTITEKAPTRAFSWLKAPTSAFTFKTLLRHYAKWMLTPR